MTDKTYVLIVGAGPVGLTLACELQRYGVPYRIIDKKSGGSKYSKALGYWPITMETWYCMDVLSQMKAVGHNINSFAYYRKQSRLAKVQLQQMETQYRYGLALSQAKMEAVLLQQLESLGGKVHWNCELVQMKQQKGNVLAKIHAKGAQAPSVVSSEWCVGCDGAHSVVRQYAGIQFPGSSSHHVWGLADVKIGGKFPLDEREIGAFVGKGPLLLFPLGHKIYRFVYLLSEKADENEQFPTPTKKSVIEIVKNRTNFEFAIEELRWSSVFKVQYRHVTKYQKHRVFLAGDAAHIHSPAGGQGANMGMQDAYNLAWKFRYTYQKKASDKLLSSYSPERLRVVKSILPFSKALERFFNLVAGKSFIPSFLLPVLHTLMFKIILPIPALQKQISNKLAQLQINYRYTPTIPRPSYRYRSSQHFRLQPGDYARVPSYLKDQDGNKINLLDKLKGEKFILLLLARSNTEIEDLDEHYHKLIGLEKKLAEYLECYVIVDADLDASDDKIFMDPSGEFLACYGIREKGYFLIRPDRYIAFVKRNIDEEAIMEQIQKSLYVKKLNVT